jgi:hypothetical protein
VVDTARRRADLTAADERAAEDDALTLLSSASSACEQAFARAATTIPGNGNDHDARDMQEDAAANGARAMCAAAGILLQRSGVEAALALLDRAVPLYEGLLSSEQQQQQDDDPPVEALTDLADALMQRAEARAAAATTGGPPAAATAATTIADDASRALQCYARACGACDSARGDDLPGLLHNWGVGLYTAASRLAPQVLAVQPSSPFPPATQLLGEAAGKLRAAAAFGRGDPQPHNALGDVLVALSERALAAAESTSSVAQAAATGLTSGDNNNNNNTSLLGRAAAATRDALVEAQSSPRALSRALLRAAVDEGYGAALTLSRRDADGLVGCAEVAVLLGRQQQQEDQDAAAAHAHFADGARLYAQALRDAPPQALGSVEERMACAWNEACAVALAGDVAGAAAALLAFFARWPPPSASAEEARRQVLEEEDLRAVWSQPGWEGAVFG